MSDIILEMKKIYLMYPNGIVANDGVNFSLKKGEIHALLGENGAGKSSLMKVLFGINHPQEGEVLLKGDQIILQNPQDAINKGIGMVHQHFKLVPSLSVAENIILGAEPKKGIFFHREEAIRIASELAVHYDFQIDVEEKVENLPVGIKQKVEILKSLYRGAEILILDEPTAVLTPQETKELFKQLMLLKDKGHTIIFISHKLDEIEAICDRLTILRHGKTMGTYKTSEISRQEISKLMVGRNVIFKIKKEPSKPQDTVLHVNNLVVKNQKNKEVVRDVSFSLRAGEILCVAGVEGNGQTQLIDAITGMNNLYHGTISLNQENIQSCSIHQIRSLGLSHIPEDRMTRGVAENMDITSNLISEVLTGKAYIKRGFLEKKRIQDLTTSLINEFRIVCKSGLQKIKMLSGGNIQKVVVAREVFQSPKVIVANQPTRGVDIGAAQFIREKLVELRDKGSGILLVTADLNEVFELADRVIVLYKGEIAAVFEDTAKLTEEELGFYMLGVKKNNKKNEVGYA